MKVSLCQKESKIEFVRFESLKELDGMLWDEREEKRREWGRGSAGDYEPVEAVKGVSISKRVNDLSSLSLHFSSTEYLKTEGNQIIHHGSDHKDTCIIDRQMKTVLFSRLFSLLHSIFITGYL